MSREAILREKTDIIIKCSPIKHGLFERLRSFVGRGFLDDQLIRKGSAPRGLRQEHAFEGRLWTDNVPDSEYTFSIPDFSIQEGSCHLIMQRGEESFTLVLHPVEMWTYLKRYNPGRDGTAKLFL